MAILGGGLKGVAKNTGKKTNGRGSTSPSAYDQWLKDNPTYFVSSQDNALAKSNPMFASDLMKNKSDYYKYQLAGNQSGMSASNTSLNTMRDMAGGYTAGTEGNRYDVTRPYTASNTMAMGMRQGNNDLARDMYNKMVQQGTARLSAQKGDINKSYDNIAQQAYISHMQGQRDMPQQMATMGMTGGASESALLGARAGYEGNQNKIGTDRNKALSDLDLAIQDLMASGDLQTAQYILQNAERNAEGYTNAAFADIGRRDTLDQQTIQNAYQQAGLTGMYHGAPTLQGQQFALNKQQASRDEALTLLRMGLGLDYVSNKLGLPISELQQYVSQNMMGGSSGGRAGGRSRGGSRGGGGGNYGDTVTYADGLESHRLQDIGHLALNLGMATTPFGAMFGSQPTQTGKTTRPSGMMTQTEWVRHKNSGNDASGASNYDRYADYVAAYQEYLKER